MVFKHFYDRWTFFFFLHQSRYIILFFGRNSLKKSFELIEEISTRAWNGLIQNVVKVPNDFNLFCSAKNIIEFWNLQLVECFFTYRARSESWLYDIASNCTFRTGDPPKKAAVTHPTSLGLLSFFSFPARDRPRFSRNDTARAKFSVSHCQKHSRAVFLLKILPIVGTWPSVFAVLRARVNYLHCFYGIYRFRDLCGVRDSDDCSCVRFVQPIPSRASTCARLSTSSPPSPYRVPARVLW